MKQVVVLGASFAGLNAALRLRRLLPNGDRVVLVSHTPAFVFRISLPWIVFGKRKPEQITVDVRPLLTSRGVEFVHDVVEGMDPKGCAVATRGGRIPYDYLLVGLGARLDWQAVPGLREHGHSVLWMDDARKMARALDAFEGGEVVFGLAKGSPHVCPEYEMALQMDDYLRRRGIRGRSAIHFVSVEPRPYAVGGDGAAAFVEGLFRDYGIIFHPGTTPVEVSAGRVVLSDGSEIPSTFTSLSPAYVGTDPVRWTPGLADERGFVLVGKDMRSKAHPNIFAAGDAVAYAGIKTGRIAELQAGVAAENIARELRGQAASKEYRPEFLCVSDLGHGQGVAAYGKAAPGEDQPRNFVALGGRVAYGLKLLFEWYYLTWRIPGPRTDGTGWILPAEPQGPPDGGGRWEGVLNELAVLRLQLTALGQRIEAARTSLDVEESAEPEDLDRQLRRIRLALGESTDLVVRELRLGGGGPRLAAVYLEGLVDQTLVGEQILRPLMEAAPDLAALGASTGQDLLDLLRTRVLAATNVRREPEVDAALGRLFGGDTLVLAGGAPGALACETAGYRMRPVEEPTSESGVRVPRDGFTESLQVNLSLLRRRIHSPDLWIEGMRIGRVTGTRVALAYLRGTADDDLVAEARRRLRRIDIDGVLESGYLEEFIEDNPYSPFPQTLRTERPDVVAANLLEGRVAIFTDNTPFVLVAPVVLTQLLGVSEDYYERFLIGSALRLLRYAAFVGSMILPAVYIAVTTFHQEMLPTSLLLSVAAAREGVPFPAIVEAMLMELMFEVLREAGVRLPRVVGPAISIVGALVLGQAAISASLVSPAMVVVVAVTAIASFSTPAFSLAIGARLLRFAFMIAAAALGLFGVMTVGIAVLLHLAALRSLGVPYLSPLGPLVVQDWRDMVVRAPWWVMKRRPRTVGSPNRWRQPAGEPARVLHPERREGPPGAAEERG